MFQFDEFSVKKQLKNSSNKTLPIGV